MGPTELALEAAAYITASGTANNGTLASLTAPQKRRIASDLSATMQEVYDAAPQLYRRRLAAQIRAPHTEAVTAGEEFGTTYEFVPGSTVNVGGNFYETLQEDEAVKFLQPFAGNPGVQPGTFYDDCILLPDTVESVISPVVIAGGRELDKRVNREDAMTRRGGSMDYGRMTRSSAIHRYAVGQPSAYWVEAFLLLTGQNDDHESQLRLRLLPLPDRACTIEYDVLLRAPKFTVEDLGDDDTPSQRSLVVPNAYVESIVRPIFLYMWSASAWFNPDPSKLKRLEQDAIRARGKLVEFRAQRAVNRTITAI